MSSQKKIAHRILGIDPGTAIVGWGILEISHNTITPKAIAYGHISTSATKSDADRLHAIRNDIKELITTYHPHALAIEDLFYFKNKKTIITVAQARGVIIEVCRAHHLSVTSYTPLQIKQSLTSYGRASKKQMQEMITRSLALMKTPEPDDTADALAVALCHNNSMRYHKRLEIAAS